MMRVLGRSTNNVSALSALVAGLALLGMGAPAQAQVTHYSLEVDGSSEGLGVSSAHPAGTIDVNRLSANEIIITMTLNPTFKIHNGNSQHPALAFNLSTLGTVTFSNLTPGFNFAVAPVTAPPFGNFNAAITCGSACGPGFGGGYPGPLTIDIKSTQSLSLTSNLVSGKNIYFSTDLVIANGNTGNVGVVASPH
jgi:hypothetical protein